MREIPYIVSFFFQQDTKEKKRGFIDECEFSVTSRVRAHESRERVRSGSRKWVPKIHESVKSLSSVIAYAFFYNAFQTFYGVLELFGERKTIFLMFNFGVPVTPSKINLSFKSSCELSQFKNYK